jgi:hypothetical protein
MSNKAKGILSFLRPVWHELSSWGSGVDFSFHDHLQDRIEQLEKELTEARQVSIRVQNAIQTGTNIGQLEQCW